MKTKNSLGDRMKQYEYVTRQYLTRRMPYIIRIDGRAFHSFTKNLGKPFDSIFMRRMQETARYLCQNIDGCKIAYVQSDEISLLLIDYENLNTEAWFDKSIQKIISISASLATVGFNQTDRNENKKWATFDSRCFVLPKEEVCNYFIWRQQDATRNSIQMLGQANFSHKQLQNKNCNQIQDMLFLEKNINWNDLEITKKRGSCIIKLLDGSRTKWIIDEQIPVFTENREYIEKYL